MLEIFKCLYSWATYRKIHKNWTKTHQYEIGKTKNPRCTNTVAFHFPFCDHVRKATCMEEQAHDIHRAHPAQDVVSETQKQMPGKRRENRRTSTLHHLLHMFFWLLFPYSSSLSKARGYNFLLLVKFWFLLSSYFWTQINFLTSSRLGQGQNTLQLTWVLCKNPLSLTCFQSFAFHRHLTVEVLGLKESKQLFPVHRLHSSRKFIYCIYPLAVSLSGYQMQKGYYYGSLFILKGYY